MAVKGKGRIEKVKTDGIDNAGKRFTYRVPDGRTWTVQHWKDNGLSHKQIGKLMNISAQVVGTELEIMRIAILADYDPDKLRQSLGILVPQSVQAVSKGLTGKEVQAGQLGAKILSGLGGLQPEMQVEQKFLNITGSEVIAQLFNLIRSDPEYMLLARQALLAEDSQSIQVSGPDNLPTAVRAERLKRQEEAKKKHALSREGHTPEKEATVPDIQEGSTPHVGGPYASNDDSFELLSSDSTSSVKAQNQVTVDYDGFPVVDSHNVFPASDQAKKARGSFDADVSRETESLSSTGQGLTEQGGLSGEKESLSHDERVDLEFGKEYWLETPNGIVHLRCKEVPSCGERCRFVDNPNNAEQPGKQVKRVELKIRPGEDD